MKKQANHSILTICTDGHKAIYFEGKKCPFCAFKNLVQVQMEDCFDSVFRNSDGEVW